MAPESAARQCRSYDLRRPAADLHLTPVRTFPVLDQAGWTAVAFIIIVGTVISFSFFIQGVCDIGPLKGTLMGTLEPLVASAVSACWLHTSFHAVELLGYALILSTVFIIMVKPEE